jgi:phenylalanyl-tRNA synthetase beta chain
MPTIKYDKKTIFELLGRRISDEQLADRISFLGTGFEGINADEIDVEIFPNRPDLLSEQGMARALSSFMDIKPGFRNYIVKKSGVKVIIDKSVKGIRPYTACAIIKGLKLDDERIKELIQIQEKLHITYGRNRKKAAIGIYPLEHIRTPIYYKALHPEEIKFKPLDLNKDLTGSQILAIHPTGREYGYLLEGKDKYPVFIDAKQAIMSMPPIINSNNVGKISLNTKDVFIECSGFDFNHLHVCLNMVVTAMADMGGQIYSVELQYPEKKYVTPELAGRNIKLDLDYVNKILGTTFKEPDLKKYLGRMGHDYKNKIAIVPNYRADILHPIDLVEDIAIAYGYEKFNGTLSNFSSVAHEKPIERFKESLRELLIGMGLIEVKNFHLTNKNVQTKLMNYNIELAELENSVTQDYNVLRAWIIPSLMETLKYNKHYDYPQNIFEMGTVFRIDDSQDIGLHEVERLGIVFCGNDANFTKAKQVLDNISDALSIKYDLSDTDHGSFIKGRSGRMIVNGSKIAYIGEMHPQVLSNWTIDMPVAAIEINVTELFRLLYVMHSEFREEIVKKPLVIKNDKIEKLDVQKVVTNVKKSKLKPVAKKVKSSKIVKHKVVKIKKTVNRKNNTKTLFHRIKNIGKSKKSKR